MPFPTKDEFVEILRTTKLRDIVKEHIFRDAPFAFRDAPEDYEALRSHLSAQLGIPPTDFKVVGSGGIGFSLAPDKFGIPFGPESDLDVVVVSDSLFDKVWFDLLRMPPSQFANLSQRQKQRIHEHRQNELFWGRIWPASLLGIAPSARQWVEAFRSVGRNPRLAYHETKGRLYRTWQHAEIYHIYGLHLLKTETLRNR